jgi:hypothetical protein
MPIAIENTPYLSNTMKFLAVSVLTLFSHIPTAFGFSTGAGGCDNVNGAAVSGFHLTNNPRAGTLAEKSIQFQLDGTTSLTANVVASIVPGQTYTLNIVPAAGATFLGALIRVESTGAFTLTPGTDGQVSTFCVSPVVGVTHTSNSEKTGFSGTFVADVASDYIVDVTVVISNDSTLGSEYYYSKYLLQAADAAATPMATSTSTPVAAPVVVTEPVAEPTGTTGAPVAVVDQTSDPVAGPVDNTNGPDVSPTTTPVKGTGPTLESPTTGPIATNETAPVETPTSYGSPTSTDSNVTAPVRAPAKTPVNTPVKTPTTSSASSITITLTFAVFVFIVMSIV